MTALWLELGALLLGFLFLTRGADALVDGGATLARRSGVRPIVVGLTVVAWGTSLPEVVVSTLAAVQGKPASSLGNVLGSNVANIGLVLGLSACILPAILLGRARKRDLAALVGSLAALWFACSDGVLSRVEAAVFLGVFLAYTWVTVKFGTSGEAQEAEHEAAEHQSRRPWTAVLLGSVAIAAGANFVIYGAEGLAVRIGMPDRIVGLTIFALGTSLPELAAGVSSAFKGQHEIGYGNVVGSNVFNALGVTGIAAAVHPLSGEGIDHALHADFPVAMGFSLVLVTLPFLFKNTAGRLPGVLLVMGYVVYVGVLLRQTIA